MMLFVAFEALSEGFRDFAALTNVFTKPTQGFHDFVRLA